MNYLSNLIKQIRKAEISIEGCSKEEVEKINGLVNMPLPKAYIEFLESMGKEMRRKEPASKGFLAGIDVFYEYIPGLKDGAKDLLKEDESSLQVGDNDFVFYMAQGCDFAFFKLNEGDNPPVYYYREGIRQSQYKIVAGSFSSFLEKYFKEDSGLFAGVNS